MYYWNFPFLILLCIHSITSNGNLVDGREYSCERLRLCVPDYQYDTRLDKFSPKNHVIRELNRDLSILQRSREQRNSRITERHFEATRQVRTNEDQIKSFRILNQGLRLSQDRTHTNFQSSRQTEVYAADRYESNVVKRINKTQIRILLGTRSVDDINLPRRGETTARLKSSYTPAEWNINLARRHSRKISREYTRRIGELSSDSGQVREERHFLDRRERLYSPEARRVNGKRNIILENITSNRITDQSREEARNENRRRSRSKEMRIQSSSENISFRRVYIMQETEKRDIETRSTRISIKKINAIDIRNSNGMENRVDRTIRERAESQRLANRMDIRKGTRSNSIEARNFNVRRDIIPNQLNRRDGYLNVRQRLENKIRADTSMKYSERTFFADNKESSNKEEMGRDNLQKYNIQSRCNVLLRNRLINGEGENSILRTGGIRFRDSREFLERDVAVRNGDARVNRRNIHLNFRQLSSNEVDSRTDTRNAQHGVRLVNQVQQYTFMKSFESFSVKDNRDSTERVRNDIERHDALRQGVRKADLRLITRNVQSRKYRLMNEVRQDSLLRFERISFRDKRDSSHRVRINIERNADIRIRNTQNIRRINVRERLTNEDQERSFSGSSERIRIRDNRESTRMIRNNMERDAALRLNGNIGIRNPEVLSRLMTDVREDSLRSFERNDFINNRQFSKRVRINVERDVALRGVTRNDRFRRDTQSSRRLENQIREDSSLTIGRADIRDDRLSTDRIRHNLDKSYSEKLFLRNSYIQSRGRSVNLDVKQCQSIEMRDIPTLISGKGIDQNNRISADRNRRIVERIFVERRDVRSDNTKSIERRNSNVKHRGSRDELDSSLRTRHILREYNSFLRNPRNMTHKNKTEYGLFNWQTMFYTLQAIYICSIVFGTMHKNEFTKKKTWSRAWLLIPDTKIN